MTIKSFDPVQTKLSTGINLIEASAGTGKTYAIAMLVLRFVVEQELDIKKILVVTFTKLATEELKERIRNRLIDARDATNYRQGAIRTTKKLDNSILIWLETLSIDSSIILQRINQALLDIDQANILTIHGFCQRILAEYALESGQLFDSELTGDISNIKQACSDDFWRKTIYPRSAWEISLLTAQFKTPDQLLASVDYILPDSAIIPNYEDLDSKLDALKQLLNTSQTKIESNVLKMKGKWAEGKFKPVFEKNFKSTQHSFFEWLKGNSTTLPDFSPLTQQGLLGGLNGQKFRNSKTNPLTSEEQKQAYFETLQIDFELFETLDSAIANITLFLRRALLKTLHEEVDKKLQQLNILSFDHLIIRLSEALLKKEIQSLSDEIRQRYQVALIDEFQDTDKSQWSIFSTLFNAKQHYLYLIGDPKQAIYKFRGADIQSYFLAKKQAEHNFNLEFNWRSHPHLVAGVNELFSRDDPFYANNLNFIPINPALSAKQSLVFKDKDVTPIILWQLYEKESSHWSSANASHEIIIAVVNEILNLLTDYSIKDDEQQAIQPKDIAILVRTNQQGLQFQNTLNESGVTAVISGKASVFCSQEAFDLYLLLRAIAKPTDITLLKEAMTLEWFNLTGQQVYQILNNELSMDKWSTRFYEYSLTWLQKGLMAMMEQLIAKENILPHLSTHRLAERRITNLQHCIELVQQGAIDDHLGVNKTLDWLQNRIIQANVGNSVSDEHKLRLESDENAIKIITLHSAKGLEYPVVFCPFLWQRDKQLKKEQSKITCHSGEQLIVDLGSDQFEYHRDLALEEELAEDLRLFYVAVTRAKYRCYLNWADVRTKDKENKSAMAYLFGFSASSFSEQQEILQGYVENNYEAFEYRLLTSDQMISENRQQQTKPFNLFVKEKNRSIFSYWQMSSYTALSSLSVQDEPELPDDKAREENDAVVFEESQSELPKGPHTGNVIHDLLENISFSHLAEGDDISQQREKSCLRYGLKISQPELINDLLKTTVNTFFSIEQNRFCLKKLSEDQCLKEMPFYLSMKQGDVSKINSILKDCPTVQPLSSKTMSGYLTGFIDLICEYQGKYYLLDYKSNGLESYHPEALVTAMREHNYGLQYWLYSLVLHQYLSHRLSNYNYEQHFGGVFYLFVRGMNENITNSGVFQDKPELEKIEQLAQLIIPATLQ